MENSEKIIPLIKLRGPVLPSDISKILGRDLLLTSAMLSELVKNNELKISYLKIGGSPLYYIKGQEYKLQHFSEKLHEKEKKAYDLLKQSKVLRDNELEPVIRVALRQIKDFAVPLQVNYHNNPEIFWKWFLVPNNEAEVLIRQKLNIPSLKEQKTSRSSTEQKLQKQDTLPQTEEKSLAEERKEESKKEQKKQEPKKFIDSSDNFYNQIKRFFDKNNIRIIGEEIKKKRTDIEYIIEIPTTVGSVGFFCKAKNKKLINDKDLAMASIQGQAKKLPVLFLTKGQLTKKASEMLLKEFKDIKIKRI